MKTKKKPFRLDILFLVLSLACFASGGMCTFASRSFAKPAAPGIADNTHPSAPGISDTQAPAQDPDNNAGLHQPLSGTLTLAGNIDQPEVMDSLSGPQRIIARINDPSLLNEEMADRLKTAGVEVLCIASDQVLYSREELDQYLKPVRDAGIQVTGLYEESPAILEVNDTRTAVLSYTYNVKGSYGTLQFALDENTPLEADVHPAVNLYGSVKSDYSDYLINDIDHAKNGPNPADYVIVYLQCGSELSQDEPLLQSLLQNMKEKGADLIVLDTAGGTPAQAADPAAGAGAGVMVPGQISSGVFFQVSPDQEASIQVSGPLSLEQLTSVIIDPDDPEAKG